MKIEVIKKKKSIEIVYPAIFESRENGMWVCAYGGEGGVVVKNANEDYPLGCLVDCVVEEARFTDVDTWKFIGNASVKIEVEEVKE